MSSNNVLLALTVGDCNSVLLAFMDALILVETSIRLATLLLLLKAEGSLLTKEKKNHSTGISPTNVTEVILQIDCPQKALCTTFSILCVQKMTKHFAYY